jgi:hypothetical protein
MIDVLDKQRQGLDPKLKEIVDDEDRESRDFIVCATCSHIITRKSDRIDVNGSMDHRLTNPYGLEFQVGCFTEALGCSISGERVAADTWFPGFQWRLASCAECRHHLGWYFDQSGSYFYGLVLTYIQDA